MSVARVCLTLVAGRELRQELFDYLSEQTDLVPGFTASDAAGHGPTIRLHSAAERVKGRAIASWSESFWKTRRRSA